MGVKKKLSKKKKLKLPRQKLTPKFKNKQPLKKKPTFPKYNKKKITTSNKITQSGGIWKFENYVGEFKGINIKNTIEHIKLTINYLNQLFQDKYKKAFDIIKTHNIEMGIVFIMGEIQDRLKQIAFYIQKQNQNKPNDFTVYDSTNLHTIIERQIQKKCLNLFYMNLNNIKDKDKFKNKHTLSYQSNFYWGNIEQAINIDIITYNYIVDDIWEEILEKMELNLYDEKKTDYILVEDVINILTLNINDPHKLLDTFKKVNVKEFIEIDETNLIDNKIIVKENQIDIDINKLTDLKTILHAIKTQMDQAALKKSQKKAASNQGQSAIYMGGKLTQSGGGGKGSKTASENIFFSRYKFGQFLERINNSFILVEGNTKIDEIKSITAGGKIDITDPYYTNVSGNVEIKPDINVKGGVSIEKNNDINVKGGVSIEKYNDINVKGDVEIKPDINVKGDVEIDKPLVVSGNVSIEKDNDINVKGDVEIKPDNDINVKGGVQMRSSVIDVKGDVQIRSNVINVNGNANIANSNLIQVTGKAEVEKSLADKVWEDILKSSNFNREKRIFVYDITTHFEKYSTKKKKNDLKYENLVKFFDEYDMDIPCIKKRMGFGNKFDKVMAGDDVSCLRFLNAMLQVKNILIENWERLKYEIFTKNDWYEFVKKLEELKKDFEKAEYKKLWYDITGKNPIPETSISLQDLISKTKKKQEQETDTEPKKFKKLENIIDLKFSILGTLNAEDKKKMDEYFPKLKIKIDPRKYNIKIKYGERGKDWKDFIIKINSINSIKVTGEVTIENNDIYQQLWNEIKEKEKTGKKKYITNLDNKIIKFNNIVWFMHDNMIKKKINGKDKFIRFHKNTYHEMLKPIYMCKCIKDKKEGKNIFLPIGIPEANQKKLCENKERLTHLFFNTNKNIIEVDPSKKKSTDFYIKHENWEEFLKILEKVKDVDVKGKVTIETPNDINVQGNVKMPDKYDILWEELKNKKVCDHEKISIKNLKKFIKGNNELPELLTPLKILNTQNDLNNFLSIKGLNKRFDFKMDDTYIYYTHTDTSKPVGESWRNFIKAINRHTTVTGNIEIKDSSVTKVDGKVKIENANKYDRLWNNIQEDNKDPKQIKFKDIVKAANNSATIGSTIDPDNLLKNLENCNLTFIRTGWKAPDNCYIKKLIDRLIEEKIIIKETYKVLGDYYIKRDNWKDFIDSINKDVEIWEVITRYSKTPTLTPSMENILTFFFDTNKDKYDKSIKEKLEQDLNPINAIPIFLKTDGFMKKPTEKKDDELGTPEKMFLKVLKDIFNNTYVVGDKIIMNARMTENDWVKLLENIEKLNVISIKGDVTIKDPSIINVSGKIRCKPIINRKEYIKINEILLHFNMFKDILIQNNYKIYNLTHIPYQNEITHFFYEFDTTKLKKDLKQNSNNFIYIDHNEIFKEYGYINLILFISDKNKNLLEKFVYGVEIKKNFKDYSAKIGSLSYCKDDDYAYYVLDQEKFPTFILNKEDEQLKKITSIYNNDYDGKYDEYNLNTVLNKVVLYNTFDTSDDSYDLLVDDDDDLNFKQDETTERIEEFSKYRILKNIEDIEDIENTKKIVEKYEDNDLVYMLIKYHIHHRSDDEFEYIKIIPDNRKKTVLKLLLNKIL